MPIEAYNSAIPNGFGNHILNRTANQGGISTLQEFGGNMHAKKNSKAGMNY